MAEKHSCGLICHASIKKATWLKIKTPNALTACINIAVGEQIVFIYLFLLQIG